jgi:hypothetical protein
MCDSQPDAANRGQERTLAAHTGAADAEQTNDTAAEGAGGHCKQDWISSSKLAARFRATAGTGGTQLGRSGAGHGARRRGKRFTARSAVDAEQEAATGRAEGEIARCQ